jgi:head-tail adaptor
VLAYLARYTHRVAISNSRLISLADGAVTFRWKDYRQAGKAKVMTLAAAEFMRASSCTPCRMASNRIRYYGLFANGHRAEKLAICRRLLGVSTGSALDTDGAHQAAAAGSTDETHICPACGGRLITIETCKGSDAKRRQMYPVMRCDTS